MDFEQFIEDLRNLDAAEIQNLGQAPLILRAFFWLLSFIAALAAMLVLTSQAHYSRHQQLIKEEESLKEKFVVESRQAANKDKFESQLEEIQESFGVLLKKLPETIEVDRLIGNINSAAFENRVQIKELSPGKMVNKEFYNELPLSVSFSGTYHNIGRFISQLSNLTQIITIHEVGLERSQDQQSGLTVVTGRAIAKTYSYVPDESRN